MYLLLTSSRLEKGYVKAVVREKSRTRGRVRGHDLKLLNFLAIVGGQDIQSTHFENAQGLHVFEGP